MGGRSRSSSTQSSTNQQFSQVNDGDFAGASDINIDESDNSVTDSYNTTTETTVEDSFNTTTNFTDESDNSVSFVDESDNSQVFTDESDNSFNDESDNSFNDESDRSISDAFNQSFTDESDNSVNNSREFTYDGEYAGNSGTINITDGGLVEESLQFARDSNDSNNRLLTTSIMQLNDTVRESGEINADVVNVLSGVVDSNSESFAGLVGDTIGFVTGNAGQSLDAALDFGNNALNANGELSLEAINESLGFAENIVGSLSSDQNAAGNRIVDISATAINESLGFAQDAITSNNANAGDLVNLSLQFGSEITRDAITSTQGTSENAIGSILDSLKESLGFGSDAISSLERQSQAFANNLTDITAGAAGVIEEVTESAIINAGQQVTGSNQAQLAQLETVAELAASTSSGGQTAIAESSKSIIKYLAIAGAVIGAAAAFS